MLCVSRNGAPIAELRGASIEREVVVSGEIAITDGQITAGKLVIGTPFSITKKGHMGLKNGVKTRYAVRPVLCRGNPG